MRTDTVPAVRPWMLAPPALFGALLALWQIGAFESTGAPHEARLDAAVAPDGADRDPVGSATRGAAIQVLRAPDAAARATAVIDADSGADPDVTVEIAALQKAQSAELAAD